MLLMHLIFDWLSSSAKLMLHQSISQDTVVSTGTKVQLSSSWRVLKFVPLYASLMCPRSLFSQSALQLQLRPSEVYASIEALSMAACYWCDLSH